MATSLSCGFFATRSALLAINVFYMVVSVVLVSMGAYAKSASMVTSVSVLGGIIAAGVLLFIVAALGIYGTRKHHQATLFFYMVILLSVFLVQLSVAIACLGAVSEESLQEVIVAGWESSSKDTKWDTEKAFQCCGLRRQDEEWANNTRSTNCRRLSCWNTTGCGPCLETIVRVTSENLSRVGGFSLFFSFLELIGIWLAMRFRNLKDPNLNPSALFYR